jgi:hypothetical protein
MFMFHLSMQVDLLAHQCKIKLLLGRLVPKLISILTISFLATINISHNDYLCTDVLEVTPFSIYITKIHPTIHIMYINLKIICSSFLGDLWGL